MALAKEHNLYVIRQCASDRANCSSFWSKKKRKLEPGHVGATSFFHLKNLVVTVREVFLQMMISSTQWN
jgi:dTDP-4-amino-4,6-dideoxygalactose transaminase